MSACRHWPFGVSEGYTCRWCLVMGQCPNRAWHAARQEACRECVALYVGAFDASAGTPVMIEPDPNTGEPVAVSEPLHVPHSGQWCPACREWYDPQGQVIGAPEGSPDDFVVITERDHP
jgi:hypothetical protein